MRQDHQEAAPAPVNRRLIISDTNPVDIRWNPRQPRQGAAHAPRTGHREEAELGGRFSTPAGLGAAPGRKRSGANLRPTHAGRPKQRLPTARRSRTITGLGWPQTRSGLTVAKLRIKSPPPTRHLHHRQDFRQRGQKHARWRCFWDPAGTTTSHRGQVTKHLAAALSANLSDIKLAGWPPPPAGTRLYRRQAVEAWNYARNWASHSG